MIKILRKSFEWVQSSNVWERKKITNAKPRRIYCHAKSSSDIAASQPKVRPGKTGFKTRGAGEGTKCN